MLPKIEWKFPSSLAVDRNATSMPIGDGPLVVRFGSGLAFPCEGYTDSVLIVAEMWLDELIRAAASRRPKLEFEFFDSPDKIRVTDVDGKNETIALLPAGKRRGTLETGCTFREFSSCVSGWLNAVASAATSELGAEALCVQSFRKRLASLPTDNARNP